MLSTFYNVIDFDVSLLVWVFVKHVHAQVKLDSNFLPYSVVIFLIPLSI